MPKRTVPAEWPDHLPCKLAFVGEAPSDDEMLIGRPLVGPSGRVFNQLLACANIDRKEHLVTNVFDFQLPDNEVKNICAGTEEMRTWEGYDLPPIDKGAFLRPEFVPCLDRLRSELERAQPTVIVPLGATALWALTSSPNISATRGTVVAASRLVPGIKLVPTLHPAHVIHEWKFFHVVVADLNKAMRESAYPQVKLPKRELWLVPSLDDMDYFKTQYLDQTDLISVDIETGWKQITCIGFAPDAGHTIVVPFWDMRKPSRSYWPSTEDELLAWEWCQTVLESDTPKLLQNGPYDIFWLWDKYGIKVRNYRQDTRLIHHALYPELPKSLEFMGATHANQGPWKLMRAHGEEKRDA